MIPYSRSFLRLHVLRVGLALALSLLACGCAGIKTPNPESAQSQKVLLQQARQEYALGHDQNALSLYSRAARMTPGNSGIHFNRGCCFLRLNKCTAAMSAFQTAVELDPGSVPARVNLAKANICLGRNDTALDILEALEAQHPDNEVLHYNLGVLHQDQNRFEQAEKAFSRAIQLNPDFARAYTNRGIVRLHQQRHQKALLDLTQAINRSIDPSATSYFNRGVVFEAMARFKEAVSDYSKAVSLEPNYAPAYYNRGFLRLYLEEEHLGEEDLRVACSLGLCSGHDDRDLSSSLRQQFRLSEFERSARRQLRGLETAPALQADSLE